MLLDSQPSTEDTNDFSTAASGTFNARAAALHPQANAINQALHQTSNDIKAAKSDLTLEELGDIQDQIETMGRTVRKARMKHYINGMKERIAPLVDPEASDFGQQFLTAMHEAGCHIKIDETIPCLAVYRSYSYADHNRGFANEIAVNPKRMEDEDKFTCSTAHEFFHAFQKRVSPALKRSPFNPDTHIIIHPADWIMLEAACERDAYTKQAFLNTLLAKENPHIRHTSNFDIVNVGEFEHTRAAHGSLADAVVATALRSLQKPMRRSMPNGRNFVHHYQDVALNNFSNGMTQRDKESESGHLFVRLELDDLWQVGNYGVGPNSFGENIQEPLFAKRHRLSPDAADKLAALCQKYNIPPLEACPTLREVNESLETGYTAPSARKQYGLHI